MTNEIKDILEDSSSITCDGKLESEINLEPIDVEQTIPSGIDLLNLNLSGTTKGGFYKGSIVQLTAESGVGKSLFALHLMKSCIEDGNRFKDYKMRYIDKENGCNFALPPHIKSRIEFYNADNMKENLATVDRTYTQIMNWLDEGTPQIIVLDSLDAFVSEAVRDSIEQNQKIVYNNKSTDLVEPRMASTAAASSRCLPIISEKVNKTGSLLIIISQFRDNIGVDINKYTPYQDQRRTSGGRSVKFYGDYRVCFRPGKTIKKEVSTGRELIQGYDITIDILKNRGTGVISTFSVPFRGQGLQIGNITSMVDYLVDVGALKLSGTRYTVDWFNDGKSFYLKELKKALQTDYTLRDKLREQCEIMWKQEQEDLNIGIF